MIRALIALTLLLAGSCSTHSLGKPCDLSERQQQLALDNIRLSLQTIPDIRPEQYLGNDFRAQGTYGSKKHCTFVIRPWQSIVSELIWDGTLAFKLDRETMEVVDYYRVDEG